jgi:hypothetical protein
VTIKNKTKNVPDTSTREVILPTIKAWGIIQFEKKEGITMNKSVGMIFRRYPINIRKGLKRK